MSSERIEEDVYVTKYAETRGIMIFKGGWVSSHGDTRYFMNKPCGPAYFIGPKDWTTDRDVAIERSRSKLAKKIVAAKRKIAQMEKAVSEPIFEEIA